MSNDLCTRERANRLLATRSATDEEFWEATAYLATRFDRRSADLDVRSDDGAPQILFDWFRHARSRVPDFRLWGIGCSIEDFLNPEIGLYLPFEWNRHEILSLNEDLRADHRWEPAFRAAYATLDVEPNGPLTCCAADRLGLDPLPPLWRYLLHNFDTFVAWSAVCFQVDALRMPAFAAVIEAELLPRVPMLEGSAGLHEHDGELPTGEHLKDDMSLALWVILRKVEVRRDLYPPFGTIIERATRAADWGTRRLAEHLRDFVYATDE